MINYKESRLEIISAIAFILFLFATLISLFLSHSKIIPTAFFFLSAIAFFVLIVGGLRNPDNRFSSIIIIFPIFYLLIVSLLCLGLWDKIVLPLYELRFIFPIIGIICIAIGYYITYHNIPVNKRRYFLRFSLILWFGAALIPALALYFKIYYIIAFYLISISLYLIIAKIKDKKEKLNILQIH